MNRQRHAAGSGATPMEYEGRTDGAAHELTVVNFVAWCNRERDAWLIHIYEIRYFSFKQCCTSAQGFGSATVALSPGLFGASTISPPCWWMMVRAIDRPRPTPPVSVLRDASKR